MGGSHSPHGMGTSHSPRGSAPSRSRHGIGVSIFLRKCEFPIPVMEWVSSISIMVWEFSRQTFGATYSSHQNILHKEWELPDPIME